MNKFIEDILKFIFIFCLANFFFWTGQLLFRIVSFGKYKAPEEMTFVSGTGSSTKKLILNISSMAVGFTFWLVLFPYIYDFYIYIESSI